MTTHKDLIKTGIYPVDMENRLIINDAFLSTSDMLGKYGVRRPMPVAVVGAHLQQHQNYESFRIVSPEYEANRLLQGRYDHAHERAESLGTPEVMAAQEQFENEEIDIDAYEAVIEKAEAAA